MKVRMSEAEIERVQERAFAMNANVSDYVRARVLFDDVEPPRRLPDVEARVAGQAPSPSPAASGSEKASGPGEGPASSRASRPTAVQLAGRARVPVAIAARWLNGDEWENHWP